jgi:hypothetical protein
MKRGISVSSIVLCELFLGVLKEKNISAARLISEVVMSRGNRRFLLTVLLHRNRGVTFATLYCFHIVVFPTTKTISHTHRPYSIYSSYPLYGDN